MQFKHLAPMSGGSGDHNDDCKHDHDRDHGKDRDRRDRDRDVICIEANQICDFCFQEHRVERTFTAAQLPDVGELTATTRVMCEVIEGEITCREIDRRLVDGKDNKTLVCLAITVPIQLTINDVTIDQQVTFLKQAVLCAPEGTDFTCRVTGNCCCFVDTSGTENVVSCIFDFCVVIQSQVIVRVLVPILGHCAPKMCQTVPLCPPVSPPGCGKCD